MSPIGSSALNAPRRFCAAPAEARAAAANLSMDLPYDFTVIVHPLTSARQSIEISVGASAMLLKHKPGLWELDNKQYADRIEWSSDGVTVDRVREPRCTHGPGRSNDVQPPLEWVELIDLGVAIDEIRPRLQRVQARLGFEQTIFHAVKDGGPLVFLNVRPITAVSLPLSPSASQPTVAVRGLEELDTLTPGDIPYVVSSADRSQHLLLLEELEVLEPLTCRHSVISVPDGLLSRTAIPARELGLSVVTTNVSHDSATGTNLDEVATSKLLSPIPRRPRRGARSQTRYVAIQGHFDIVVNRQSADQQADA